MKIYNNFRVISYPDVGIRESDIDDAKELEKSILRHCDVERTELKRDEFCSFCGSTWEEDESGMPMCCNNAIDEYNSFRPKEEKE